MWASEGTGTSEAGATEGGGATMRLRALRHSNVLIYRLDSAPGTLMLWIWHNDFVSPSRWCFALDTAPGWLALSAGPLRLTLRRH